MYTGRGGSEGGREGGGGVILAQTYTWYSGNCLYLWNSSSHSASDRGGLIPLMRCHCVILRPDSVNLVIPPITIAPPTITLHPINHIPNTLCRPCPTTTPGTVPDIYSMTTDIWGCFHGDLSIQEWFYTCCVREKSLCYVIHRWPSYSRSRPRQTVRVCMAYTLICEIVHVHVESQHTEWHLYLHAILQQYLRTFEKGSKVPRRRQDVHPHNVTLAAIVRVQYFFHDAE